MAVNESPEWLDGPMDIGDEEHQPPARATA